MAPPAHPDVAAVDLQPGDRILLCSDGLHGVVDDASLAQILSAPRNPGDTCAALIEAANSGGGPDNITTIVIDVTGQ
jgi:protein phosphatase